MRKTRLITIEDLQDERKSDLVNMVNENEIRDEWVEMNDYSYDELVDLLVNSDKVEVEEL